MSAPPADELDLRLLRFRKSPVPGEGVELADALIAASRERDALSVYELLRRAAPRDASLAHRAGKVLIELGELPAAQAVLLEAIQIAPEEPTIAATLGEVLLKRGEPGRARTLLSRHRGHPAVDPLYARAERLARLSAEVVDEGLDEGLDDLALDLEPASERDTARPGDLSADDAAGFLEDQPTAMIDRSELEALRSARPSREPSRPTAEAPPAAEDVPVLLEPVEAAAKSDDDTRQIAIPLPEPEARSWSGDGAPEIEDAILDEPSTPAPGPRRRGRGALALAAALLLAGGAAAVYFVGDLRFDAGGEAAHDLLAVADRAARGGELAELQEALSKLEDAALSEPLTGPDAAIEAFGRALALLELEAGDLALTRSAAQRVEGPLREVVFAVVDFAGSRQPPATSSLPLPSRAIDPRASLLLGRLRQAAGADPSVDFELAVRDDATSVPVAKLEGALLALSRGDREAAAALVDELRGGADEAHGGARAAMLSLLARPDESAPDVLAATSPSPFDRFLKALVLAELHVARGRLQDARAELAELEPGRSRGPLGPLLAARVARRAGDLELARRFANQALELGDREHAGSLAVEIAIESGDLDRARELLADLEAETAIPLALDLARRTGQADDFERARARLPDAEISEARSTAFRLSLALAEGVTGAALDPLADALEGADDPRALLARAELALVRGETEAALELAARGVEALPGEAVGHRVLGLAALELGDAPRAEAALARAVQEGDLVARHRLAELRRSEERHAEAVELLTEETIARLPEPERPEAIRTLALALAGSGDAEAAREALEGLAGIDDEATLAARAEIGRLTGDPSAVVEALEPTLTPLLKRGKAAPEDAPLLVTYAGALEASGEAQRAGSAYQLAVWSEPTSIDARIGYARALIRGSKHERALGVLIRADEVLAERGELDARPTELLLLRGRALIELGKRDEAETFLAIAVERDDAAAEAHFFLAEALSGRKSVEARAAYEKYLELEPEGAHAKRAERAIQR